MPVREPPACASQLPIPWLPDLRLHRRWPSRRSGRPSRNVPSRPSPPVLPIRRGR